MKPKILCFVLPSLLCCLAAAAAGQDGAGPSPEQRLPVAVTAEGLTRFAEYSLPDIAPLLQTYCFECHSDLSDAGEMNVERLLRQRPIVVNRAKWINVLEQVKNRAMPPPDAANPTEQERSTLVHILHDAIYNFDYSGINDPGYESMRRLTHDEYDNTIRDLFGIDIRPTERFPTDLTGTSGFDNSANTLFIQPLLMERYLQAAEQIVTVALPSVATTSEQRRVRRRMLGEATVARLEDEAFRARVLRRFLLRAFRRPPTEAEVARTQQQFDAVYRRTSQLLPALRAVVQTTLISPKFLLRQERYEDTTEAFRVDDWDLASRLSYFLWASMPDDELFALAEAGTLQQPSVLSAQIQRMIADTKSVTLGEVFAAQWLGSQHLGTRVRLDPIDNPWCTDSLMKAMRDETALFVANMIRENRPVRELIDADYTYLNEELAELYEIEGIEGTHMRRVAVGNLRGGIFGQGSLLAVTSFPYRTSPVVRGKWILGDVLGTPPPPPPPNVSELSEELEETDDLTFREKLELHRDSPNCYACHSQIDPLGFSLEHYDWFGRYRGDDREIDVRGQLPDGTEFEGLAGLKQVVVQRRLDDLLRQLTSKMLAYALGRQLEYYDEPAVRKILARVQADDYRLHTLISEIVASYPFRYKKIRPQS